MYKNMLVCALKVNGNVLREFKDAVYLPFGSEYSIVIKNLDSRKCSVSIDIDGRDIADGSTFIVNPNSTVEIERFITKGNLSEGNKFKFIERNSAVEEHRGIKLEDGILRVRFQFESKLSDLLNTWNSFKQYTPPQYTPPQYNPVSYYNMSIGGAVNSVNCSTNISYQTIRSTQANDVGITVEGAKSNQQFSVGNIGVLDIEQHAMVIRLLGDTGQVQVEKPITVKHKPICKTCGTKNSTKVKFCGQCGASLDII